MVSPAAGRRVRAATPDGPGRPSPGLRQRRQRSRPVPPPASCARPPSRAAGCSRRDRGRRRLRRRIGRTLPLPARPPRGCRSARADGEGAVAAVRTIAASRRRRWRCDETRDERSLRPVVEFTRRVELFDAALAEHGDTIRHAQRFALVVRDEHERDAESLLQALEFACISSRSLRSSAPSGSSSSSTFG